MSLMLTDADLFEKLRSLCVEERRITGEVLNLLREVARRRLHIRRGFDSLFTFLVEELGYDESSAYRRVNAVRVIEAVPEIEQALEEGKLSIATVAQAQTFFQQEMKRQAPCSVEKKRQILQKLEGCSKREAENILAKESPDSPRPDHQRSITENQTEIRFTADPELLGLLRQVRDLTAHRKLEPGFNGLFKYLAEQALRKLDPAQNQPRKALPPEQEAAQQATTSSRYIPAAVKRAVWTRDKGACTYLSAITGRRCGSRHWVEYEHVIAWAKGGETSVANLTLHCQTHNTERAIETYGQKKMQPYLSRAPRSQTAARARPAESLQSP